MLVADELFKYDEFLCRTISVLMMIYRSRIHAIHIHSGRDACIPRFLIIARFDVFIYEFYNLPAQEIENSDVDMAPDGNSKGSYLGSFQMSFSFVRFVKKSGHRPSPPPAKPPSGAQRISP